MKLIVLLLGTLYASSISAMAASPADVLALVKENAVVKNFLSTVEKENTLTCLDSTTDDIYLSKDDTGSETFSVMFNCTMPAGEGVTTPYEVRVMGTYSQENGPLIVVPDQINFGQAD